MTRKDYIAIAEALREARFHWLYVMDKPDLSPEYAYDAAWGAVRAEIARVLKTDNPRFDRDRFCSACEGKE